MHTGVYWQIVYWLSTPTLVVIAIILFWRKLYKELPLFTIYILAAILADLARLIAQQWNSREYANIFWTTQAVVTALALLAAYELCMKRLFAAFYKVRFYRALFPAVAAIVFAIGLMTALNTNRKVFIRVQVIQVFDVLQVAILAFLVALMIFMGRRWTRVEFGIALGLGLDAAAILITMANWTKHTFFSKVSGDLPVITTDIACLVWLIAFLKPERPSPVPAAPVSPEVLREARKWEETLKGSLGKKKGLD